MSTPVVKVCEVTIPYSVYEYLENRLGDYDAVCEYLEFIAYYEVNKLAKEN